MSERRPFRSFRPFRPFRSGRTGRSGGFGRTGRSGEAILCMSLVFMLFSMLNACKKEDPPPQAFHFESVSGFVISETGEKLLATNAGLCSLDVSSGSYLAIENQLRGTSLNDLVYSYSTAEWELWQASPVGAHNFTADYLLNTANSGIQSDEVGQIGFNPENTAFFSFSGGLSLLSGDTWGVYQGMNDFFLNHEISDIASASNGYTYVTTFGGGIERFKAGVDGISGATIMDTDWTMLESDYVYSVYIDDTTQVYGTDYGVGFHFSEYTKWDWEVYTSQHGLVNDTVLSVVRDRSGNWWIGTANGVSMFDESQWVNYTINEHDMCGKQAKYLALDTDGSVWMASDNGLSRFSGGLWVAYPMTSK